MGLEGRRVCVWAIGIRCQFRRVCVVCRSTHMFLFQSMFFISHRPTIYGRVSGIYLVLSNTTKCRHIYLYIL